MLLALQRYQQVQSWHRHEDCGCVGSAQVNPNWKPNPKINTVLPESGPGYRTYNREEGGVDQVGLPSTIEFIENLGKEWELLSDIPFQVGDLSREGGGPFPPHSAHKNGTEADLRPFRKDGALEPTNINDSNYDRERTRDFVKLVKRLAPNTVVLFNDPVLIKEGLTQYYKGHHNHLHLGLREGADSSLEGC